MEENQSHESLESKVNELNRWKRLGNRTLSELKLLPYEAAGALIGYKGGSELGEDVSQIFFPVPKDSFFLNLGQDLQNNIGAFIGGMTFVIPTAYIGRIVGKYVNKGIKKLKYSFSY